jgi:hypothetical protein
MELKELQEFLSNNAQDENVQKVLKDYAPKPKLEELLQSDDYNKKFQSLLDSEKSKAVEAYKEQTLPKRVEERVKEELEKQNKKDPWQLKLEEMEEQQNQLRKQLEEKEKAEKREKLRNMAFRTASEKNLPSDLVDYFLGEDEDTTQKNLETLEKTLKSYGDSVKQNVYKNTNTTVPKEKDDEEGDSLTPQERMKKRYEELHNKES